MISDLHHGSDERLGGVVGCELDSGYDAGAEAQAIGSGGCRCKGEEAKYGTMGVNPLDL